ncbi:MAG: hypothetical protein EOO56_01455, partial [Hymenobacter sp.]
MKVFFRRIHLYLGLVSGLFLVIVCLTGSLLVFEEELEHAFHGERYTVAAATTPRRSLTQLTEAVHAARPKAKINAIRVYADPTRTVEISLAGGGPQGGEGREGRGNNLRDQANEGRGAQGNEAREGMREGQKGRGEGMRGGGRGPQASGSEARGQAGGPGAKGGRGKGGDRGPTLFVNPYTGAILGEYDSHKSFFHFIEEIHRGLVAGRVGKLIMGINSII